MTRKSRALSSLNMPAAGKFIGLLGGSFNPAHDGHRHISLWALKKLGLDEIWWLVSPQNPLKPKHGMADLSERLAGAQKISNHPHIKVTAIEAMLGTNYTVDTLAALKQRWPAVKFIWIMGADNLVQFHHWRGWQEIAASVPMLIVDRGALLARALRSRAAVFMKKNLSNVNVLKYKNNNAWAVLILPKHKASASEIRKKRGKHENSAV